MLCRLMKKFYFHYYDYPPFIPIMSPKKKQETRLSRFPLGRASKVNLVNKTNAKNNAIGRLRIPDCIVLHITDAKLIKLRMRSTGNFHKLMPMRQYSQSC